VLDIHTQAVLIQLSQADDGVPQREEVVDTSERPVLSGHGYKDDRADALDLHGRDVPKLDGALNTRVELEEELLPLDHVVGGTSVEVPPIDLIATGPFVEEDMSLWLVKVEEHGGGRRGRGVRLDAPVYKK